MKFHDSILKLFSFVSSVIVSSFDPYIVENWCGWVIIWYFYMELWKKEEDSFEKLYNCDSFFLWIKMFISNEIKENFRQIIIFCKLIHCIAFHCFELLLVYYFGCWNIGKGVNGILIWIVNRFLKNVEYYIRIRAGNQCVQLPYRVLDAGLMYEMMFSRCSIALSYLMPKNVKKCLYAQLSSHAWWL